MSDWAVILHCNGCGACCRHMGRPPTGPLLEDEWGALPQHLRDEWRLANLQSANLLSANLELANLELANLESANLESANLTGADRLVSDAEIPGWRVVDGRLVLA